MTRTVRQRKAELAVLTWCRKRKIAVQTVRHVFPACYVLGLAAPKALLIVRPWMDAESHMREWERLYPAATVHEFDPSLKAGDWCICAYVSNATSGQPIAVPIPVTR